MKLFNKSVLAAGIGAALSTLVIPAAHAVSINWGEVEGSFDSTFSAGISIRTEKRDYNNQIGKVNNPNNGLDWSNYSAFNNPKYLSTELFNKSGSYSSNGDLANLAWARGDAFSQTIKGLHELDLSYRNYGLFVRGMYYKDFALDSGLDYNRELGIGTNTERSIDVCRDGAAADTACSDVRLLDAYITADYDWGSVPVSFRVGQQVISWGESALISHGISSINAVDVGRLRTPGAELKEAFIPQGMISFSAGLTDNLSMEVFYQYQWEPIVVPVGGTYFASNDFVSEGGQFNAIQLGFNSNPDMDFDFIVSEMVKLSQIITTDPSLTAAQKGSLMLAYPTKATLKLEDEPAKDDGQYGIKFSYFVEDTEFGFYHMNYHSRRPIISGQAADFTAGAIGADLTTLATLAATGGIIDADVVNSLKTFSKAKIVYPEDIKLFGLSFNTTIGDTSVAGEIAHRVDEPVQIDDVELLFAAMPQQLANAVADRYKTANPGSNLTCADAAVQAIDTSGFCFFEGISQMDTVEPGGNADGFLLLDTTQAQVNFTHLVGPTFGADNLVLFAEIGGIWIHGMPTADELRLNGPGTSRSGSYEGKEAVIIKTHNGAETNPFPTDFAWGYRLVAKTEHNDVYAGVNASLKLIFSHDVDGTTPDPIFLFNEGSKSIGASVTFDYQNRWSATVGYNTFWGGKGTTNAMEDKDFASFSIKYSI